MYKDVTGKKKELADQFTTTVRQVGIYHAFEAIQEELQQNPLPVDVASEQAAILGTLEALLHLCAKLTIQSGNRRGVQAHHMPRKAEQ